MKLEKCIITFNSVESLEFLLDTNANSFEEVVKSLERFKTTDQYKDDDWDEGDVIDWLKEDNLSIIPLNEDIVYEFNLPDGNNQ